MYDFLFKYKNYLNVHHIYRDYFPLYDVLLIALNDANYGEKRKLLTEFVEMCGYGPFEKICPTNFSSELVNERILVKKNNN